MRCPLFPHSCSSGVSALGTRKTPLYVQNTKNTVVYLPFKSHHLLFCPNLQLFPWDGDSEVISLDKNWSFSVSIQGLLTIAAWESPDSVWPGVTCAASEALARQSPKGRLLPVGLICPAGVHLLQRETLRSQQIPIDLDHLIWSYLGDKGWITRF